MSRLPTLMLAVLVPLVACSSPAWAATRSYNVTSFGKMRIAGPFEVHVRVGGSPSARATGPQDALDRLSIEQNDDTLVVKPLPGGWGGWPSGSRGNVVIEIGAPQLNAVAIAGSGDVTVDKVRGDRLDLMLSGSGSLAVGAVDVGALSAVMTGSGDLSVAGKARAAKATLTGSGDLKAAGLAADDAQASLVGSGNLTIGARHTAKVNLAGSGDLTVAGPAACTISRSGSGDVHCDHLAKD
ncbi:head GIN domain-containing protein [Sphingomonas abietis]|uniref:DUF2807 domain-containing protein n=1 Tax=Sphingomonas abietis TaxID=3012344 RepID=A0ABY7NPX8_9SPHN|nr:head GIN domain-containing protein [Sphingomonas abietis]WBO22531.1 DUF2807 domain-containing protein [Sphingomonas abietis]